MKHIQTETEKNISIVPSQMKDGSNSQVQPKRLRVAMYCRVNSKKQVEEISDRNYLRIITDIT